MYHTPAEFKFCTLNPRDRLYVPGKRFHWDDEVYFIISVMLLQINSPLRIQPRVIVSSDHKIAFIKSQLISSQAGNMVSLPYGR
jgi:hypothetical protein